MIKIRVKYSVHHVQSLTSGRSNRKSMGFHGWYLHYSVKRDSRSWDGVWGRVGPDKGSAWSVDRSTERCWRIICTKTAKRCVFQTFLFYIIRVKYYLLKVSIASSANPRCVIYSNDATQTTRFQDWRFTISLLISQHEANQCRFNICAIYTLFYKQKPQKHATETRPLRSNWWAFLQSFCPL